MLRVRNKAYIIAALFLLLVSLLSCGGVEGTGSVDEGISGSGRTIYSKGAAQIVDGSDGVKVNGIEHQIDPATIVQVDGEAADLQNGQLVVIEGGLNEEGETVVAETVNAISNVIGPVTSVDQLSLTLMAMGQLIRVDATTVFGDGLNTINDISDQVVRVSGTRGSTGDIYATRIDVITNTTDYQVVGVLENLEGTTFTINALTVDFSGVNDLPELKQGELVKVSGLEITNEGVFVATGITNNLFSDAVPNQQINVQGLITQWESSQNFTVDNFQVVVESDVVENGNLTDLALDAQIIVYGVVNEQEKIVAQRIIIINTAPLRINGSERQELTIESTENDLALWVSIKVLAGRADMYIRSATSPEGSFACSAGELYEGQGALCYIQNNQATTWHLTLYTLKDLATEYEVEVFFRRMPLSDIQTITTNEPIVLNQRAGDTNFFRLPSEDVPEDHYIAIYVEGMQDQSAHLVLYSINESNTQFSQCELRWYDYCWRPVLDNTEWYLQFSSFAEKKYTLHVDFVPIVNIVSGETIHDQVVRPQGNLYRTEVDATQTSIGYTVSDRDGTVFGEMFKNIAPSKVSGRRCLGYGYGLDDFECTIENEGANMWYTLINGQPGANYSLTISTE